MSGNIALDIFIGLVFVYLLYSLLATVLLEILSTKLKIRANNLRNAIYSMLNDYAEDTSSRKVTALFKAGIGKGNAHKKGGLARAFYHSSGIRFLGGKNAYRNPPSYISPQQFVLGMLSIMKDEHEQAENMSEKVDDFLKNESSNKLVKEHTDNHPSIAEASKSGMKHLQHLYSDANGNLEQFKQNLNDWYEEMMRQATEWYKQKMQVWLFIIGFTLAC